MSVAMKEINCLPTLVRTFGLQRLCLAAYLLQLMDFKHLANEFKDSGFETKASTFCFHNPRNYKRNMAPLQSTSRDALLI